MRFIFPCWAYEQKAKAFIQEFYDCSSAINGTGGLDGYLKNNTYADWLTKVQKDMDIANIKPGRVPALTYFYVRETDDQIVGMINIRLALNDFLRKEGGHIGYCVRPSERLKGYGTQMLKGALDFCRTIRMSHFIITCDEANAASAGVIQNCGGVLDEQFYSDAFEAVVQRYIIK